jgi:hypothetical protein
MSGVKKQLLVRVIGIFLALSFYTDNLHAQWPTNTRNDVFKVFTSLDPQTFLQNREKALIEGWPDEKGTPELFMISLSPFGQNADKAKTIAATFCPDPMLNTCETTCNNIFCANCQTLTPPTCINSVEIGDIDGRWNLLGLLAGELPQGVTPANFATLFPLLNAALDALFPGRTPGTITGHDIDVADRCNPLFGHVSVPIKYRKRGIRWDIEARICGDFGLQFEGGLVEISQVLNPCFINLTKMDAPDPGGCIPPDTAKLTKQNVDCFLFDPMIPLLRQLGLDICNVTKWGVEDLYLSLYWRHAYTINFARDLSWARLLFIPFFRFGAGIASGKPKDQARFFSLPFGNNGSHSLNFSAGINLDFVETIEIGGEFGYSHFFKKDFDNFRVPTNVFQSSIFPFTAPVKVDPGPTTFVAGKLAAYHFLDRLSFYFQWVFVHHRHDKITLLTDDPAFIAFDDQNPRAKCPNTTFRVQLGNFGFTYDISPNIAVGFLWQQMFHVRNAYNSTTVLFTLNLVY